MSLYKDMARVVDICYDALQKNKEVQEYLKTRQITKKTIDKFFLGSFPKNVRILLKEFSPEFLLKTGLMYRADRSAFNIYPLIIPICDVNNNFIGIGGRSLLPDRQRQDLGYPKYKNSQYDKANHLFGLNYAKQCIRKENNAIVVEGYFDVITSHQAGLCNIVATSGTFLSPKQILLLSRYSENVKILFDNDDAGQKASKKYLDKIKTDGININGLFLPDNSKDIDEYICKNGFSLLNL